jgi:hypothetical protein
MTSDEKQHAGRSGHRSKLHELLEAIVAAAQPPRGTSSAGA